MILKDFGDTVWELRIYNHDVTGTYCNMTLEGNQWCALMNLWRAKAHKSEERKITSLQLEMTPHPFFHKHT